MKKTNNIRNTVSKVLWLSLSAALIVSYQSCAQWLGGNSHSAGSSASSTTSAQSVPVVPFSAAASILQQHCASCHSPTSATPTTALPDIMNQASVEGSVYVSMGKPQTSQLYLDILDGTMPPAPPAAAAGSPTPARDTLSAGEIETLREWLLASNINSDVIIGTLPMSTTGTGTGTTGPSYAAVIAPIIQNKCNGCHNGTFRASNYATFSQLQQIALAGTLVNLITSTDPAVIMPPPTQGGAPVAPIPLTATEITNIKAWVAAGAKNN